MPEALDGIRVVDFGQYVAGPLTALWLAENGADVVHVDPPGGPRWSHDANAILQRSKRTVALDLSDPGDRSAAGQLVELADVVIENFRPGVMSRLGLGWDHVRVSNPSLVYCSIPGFPEEDERADIAGWEGIVSAAAGLYNPGRWTPGNRTIFNPAPMASVIAAVAGSHAVVAALLTRLMSGRGQRVEVPIFDASMQLIGPYANKALTGRLAGPPPVNPSWMLPYQCKDGRWVDFSPPFRAVPRFARRYLSQEVLDSGVADVLLGDPANVDKLRRVMVGLMNTKTAKEWEEESNREVGNGVVQVLTTSEWLHDEHARQTECVLELDDPELGRTTQMGYPLVLTQTPMRVHGPRRQVEVVEVLAEWDSYRTPDVPTAARTNDVELPLAGIKVVDTTQVLAGPTVGRVLAEYGADVVKINDPNPEFAGGMSGHPFVNSGKRTMLLDLRRPEAHEVLGRLLESTDVVLQNFVIGAAARLGLGEEDLRRRNPGLIYTSISCHAYGGFRGGYRGHEQLGEAVTGMELRLGAGTPTRANMPVNDLCTGHLGAFGVLLALFHRVRSGEGQHVQVALSRSATMLQAPFMIDYDGRRWDEPSGLDATGWGPLDRLFQASDGYLYLVAPDIDSLRRVPGLEDATLEDLADRLSSATAAEWVGRLRAAGVAAVVSPADWQQNLADPALAGRELSIVRDHAGIGKVRMIGRWGRFSLTSPQIAFPVAAPGWDARAILEDIGMPDRYEELIAAGTVGRAGAG